jgi:hypothetical protein
MGEREHPCVSGIDEFEMIVCGYNYDIGKLR